MAILQATDESKPETSNSVSGVVSISVTRRHTKSRRQPRLVFDIELAEQRRLAAGLSPDHCGTPQFDRAAKPKLSAAFLLIFPSLFSCTFSRSLNGFLRCRGNSGTTVRPFGEIESGA